MITRRSHSLARQHDSPRSGGESPRRAALALALLVATLAVGAVAHAAPAEVRGTWLTTTGPDHIRGGTNTPTVMADLRAVGLNTVYVETWKNGYTNFPSPTLAALTGGPDRSTFLGTTRDLVDETLTHAHRQGLNYVGWFEYGLAAEFVGSGGNTLSPLGLRMRDNGWLLRDQAGQLGNASNGFAWMNPAVPEVRQFLVDVTLEAVNRYDLDGVQFDDRLAWPREFGWDSTTAAIYLTETGRSLPTNVDDTNFRNWRQGKVTAFAQQLTSAVRAARPDLHLSVSPSVTSFSDVNYNAEWPEWQDAGLFDEYAVQVYRDNYASFNATLTGQTSQFPPSQRDEFVVGLRGNGTGANTPIADLQQMITRSREVGAAGHSIFYSKAVRDDYRTQLTAFYDVAGQGPAESPVFGDRRATPPVVGSLTAASTWTFDVPQGGRYRLVGRFGTLWKEFDTASVGPGLHAFAVTGASQVELLVDRRPLDAADFNGDGLVDVADYTVWRDTLFSTVDLRADADNDGQVDADDYLRWVADFGQPAPAAAVPEPSSAALALAATLLGAAPRRGRAC